MAQNNHQSLQAVIQQIDKIIHILGDNRSSSSSSNNTNHCKNSRKRKLNDIATAVAAEPTSSSISSIHNDDHDYADDNLNNKKPSPLLGLERQYRDLYSLLQIGLLGASNGQEHHYNQLGNHHHHLNKKRNVSALLMGPRGHGKNLVLEQCLSTLQNEFRKGGNDRQQDQHQQEELEEQQVVPQTQMCRIVKLNGILLKGDDVALAVKEIVRQLSEIAADECLQRQLYHQQQRHENSNSEDDDDNGDEEHQQQQQQREQIQKDYIHNLLQKESYLLRIRQTSFNSSLALLDEILQTAYIDSIPILIVLEELDAFLGNTNTSSTKSGTTSSTTTSSSSTANSNSASSSSQTEKHLLLYHLLDRVAGHGSLLSLVGITSRLSTVSMFEKRVKSRAEGTSKVIYFGHLDSFDTLVGILLKKFNVVDDDNADDANDAGEEETDEVGISSSGGFNSQLHCQLREILSPDKITNSSKDAKIQQCLEIRNMLQRNFRLGRDLRWFCRVLSASLSFLMEDITNIFHQQMGKNLEEKRANEEILLPSDSLGLKPKHLLQGLMMMGGTKPEETIRLPLSTGKSNNSHEDSKHFRNSLASTVIDDELMSQNEGKDYYGALNGDGSRLSTIGWDNGRLQALSDLPGPQVAVLLAAKRIICRDVQNGSNVATAITFARIQKEFESSFLSQGKASGPDRYSNDILYQSFCHLLSSDLIRSAKDHTGGGPLQYYYGLNNGHHVLDEMALRKIPLHINLDIERELVVALQNKILDCTTALRDWGLKGIS